MILSTPGIFHLYFFLSDDELPVFTSCPSDVASTTDSSLPTAVVWWAPPTATDNVGVSSIVSDYTPGQTFPVNNTLVTYNATDLAGNTAQCSFWVNVTGQSGVKNMGPVS